MNKEGSVLFVDGPTPIRYHRTEERIWYPRSNRYRLFQGADRALDWIAILLGKERKELGIESARSENVVWTNLEELQSRIEDVEARFREAWRTVMRGLVERKLVTRELAKATAPNLKLIVRDYRKDKTVPIPPLDREIVLTFSDE